MCDARMCGCVDVRRVMCDVCVCVLCAACSVMSDVQCVMWDVGCGMCGA